MQERNALDDQLNAIGRIERDLADQITMIELGDAEKDQRVVTEAEAVLKALKAEAARRELEALLSGEADANEAYLEVHAGAGGTESQDWAGILLRMYTRWAEQHGYKVDFLEESEGEGAGIKSATIQVKGHNAYGWLKTENGVHLEVGLVGVGLAGQQSLKLAPRRLCLQFLQRAFGFGDDALIVLGFAKIDHTDLVVELALHSPDRIELIVERVALLHRALGAGGVIPESGVFGLRVQLGKPRLGLVEVKDASSSVRSTA
jgi:hypothetical protein